MSWLKLADYQLDAIKKMHTGCILNGGVGSGKSRTALAYYYKENGGNINTDLYNSMKEPIKDLYIITTARKRDTKEWDGELVIFLMSQDPEFNKYKNKIIIDSWNNIKKYKNVYGAFFIFDEDRVTGSGAWVKAFLDISRKNQWIILSATPGDTYSDYIPVFVANGFYKNKTAFSREHIIYSRFSKFPKIDRYLGTKKLDYYRSLILVDMDFCRPTISHHEDIYCDYDIQKYRQALKTRWDEEKQKPFINAAELCMALRKIVNEDDSRQIAVLEILEKHPKVIIFYNYNYELELLKTICNDGIRKIAEWNGHLHQPIPEGNNWVYLVHYSSCEGWNCIKTDTIIFYSQNYSYKIMVQASGRIDRMNTPYKDLYYYHLKSHSSIDNSISRALNAKKKFNEKKFLGWD